MAETINLVLNTNAGGTVNAITLTYSPAISAYTDKRIFAFVSSGANTSATPTVNINGLGARTIVKKGGQALVAGDIGAVESVHFIQYDLTNTRFELMNPCIVFGTTAGTVAQGNDSRFTPLFKINTQIVHTGTTTPTIVYTTPTAVLNSTNINAGDIARLYLSAGGTSSADQKIIEVFANTTADLSGSPIQLGTLTFTTVNNSTSGFVRNINFISLTQQLMFPQTTSNWSDELNGVSGISTDPALNISANSYFIIVRATLVTQSSSTIRINHGHLKITR